MLFEHTADQGHQSFGRVVEQSQVRGRHHRPPDVSICCPPSLKNPVRRESADWQKKTVVSHSRGAVPSLPDEKTIPQTPRRTGGLRIGLLLLLFDGGYQMVPSQGRDRSLLLCVLPVSDRIPGGLCHHGPQRPTTTPAALPPAGWENRGQQCGGILFLHVC